MGQLLSGVCEDLNAGSQFSSLEGFLSAIDSLMNVFALLVSTDNDTDR